MSTISTVGLRVLPVSGVEGRELRIIHDLMFAGDEYRLSVNFSTAPPGKLGHVFRDACRRIMYYLL